MLYLRKDVKEYQELLKSWFIKKSLFIWMGYSILQVEDQRWMCERLLNRSHQKPDCRCNSVTCTSKGSCAHVPWLLSGESFQLIQHYIEPVLSKYSRMFWNKIRWGQSQLRSQGFSVAQEPGCTIRWRWARLTHFKYKDETKTWRVCGQHKVPNRWEKLSGMGVGWGTGMCKHLIQVTEQLLVKVG